MEIGWIDPFTFKIYIYDYVGWKLIILFMLQANIRYYFDTKFVCVYAKK